MTGLTYRRCSSVVVECVSDAVLAVSGKCTEAYIAVYKAWTPLFALAEASPAKGPNPVELATQLRGDVQVGGQNWVYNAFWRFSPSFIAFWGAENDPVRDHCASR